MKTPALACTLAATLAAALLLAACGKPAEAPSSAASNAETIATKATTVTVAATAAPAASAAAPAASTPAAATTTSNTAAVNTAAGEALYKQACFACHDSGAAGAPKRGDKAAWAPRIAQGKNTLYQAAIHGLNAMPPKGGTNASDAQITAAVDYILAASQ